MKNLTIFLPISPTLLQHNEQKEKAKPTESQKLREEFNEAIKVLEDKMACLKS